MKIKSSVLFGLIVLICSISGFSLLKRMTREIDEWRPSNLYSSSNIFRRSTYSVVSSAPASYSSAVATVSSGSGSMFRHHGTSLYAPAYVAPGSLANSQYPIGGTPSNSAASPVYTTSSAEFRSFGGGGNGGGVSMSGGQVKSSASSVASASGLSVSMPSTSVYAYNTNRNGSFATDVMASVSGDITMASSQAYAGIGNTTGARGLNGRKEVPSIGGGTSDESVFMNILITICGGSADLTLTDAELWLKWSVYNATPSTAPVYWEQFLAWYQSIRTLPATPVGDAVLFVLCCALFYAIYIYVKRKKISVL